MTTDVASLGEDFTLAIGVGFALVLVGSMLATRPSATGRQPRSAGLDPAPESR